MTITYTKEAVADIVEALAFLQEHRPRAAAHLDVGITRCLTRLAGGEFEGPVSRLPDELLVLRLYHQTRRPLTR